jgi:hypothetical protein
MLTPTKPIDVHAESLAPGKAQQAIDHPHDLADKHDRFVRRSLNKLIKLAGTEQLTVSAQELDAALLRVAADCVGPGADVTDAVAQWHRNVAVRVPRVAGQQAYGFP